MSVVQELILLQPMEVSPELRLSESTKIRLEVRMEEKISGSGEAMMEIGGYGEAVREIGEREWIEGEHKEEKEKNGRERKKSGKMKPKAKKISLYRAG